MPILTADACKCFSTEHENNLFFLNQQGTENIGMFFMTFSCGKERIQATVFARYITGQIKRLRGQTRAESESDYARARKLANISSERGKTMKWSAKWSSVFVTTTSSPRWLEMVIFLYHIKCSFNVFKYRRIKLLSEFGVHRGRYYIIVAASYSLLGLYE